MTNWKPFVSVITPSYNASEYIEDTIQSVLHQSHPHWEMIIADDCSTDGTRDILRQYEQKDERIRVVYLDKNGEPRLPEIQPLNMPRYVAFLDSDDRWKKEKLQNSLRLWQSGPALFIYGLQRHGAGRNADGQNDSSPESLSYDEALKTRLSDV